MSDHHDFTRDPFRPRSVHRDDTVTIRGAEYLHTRRRLKEAGGLLRQALEDYEVFGCTPEPEAAGFPPCATCENAADVARFLASGSEGET